MCSESRTWTTLDEKRYLANIGKWSNHDFAKDLAGQVEILEKYLRATKSRRRWSKGMDKEIIVELIESELFTKRSILNESLNCVS